MTADKDRLGDKLRELEKGREDDYFARRDKELIARLREEKDKEITDALSGGTMPCPRCDTRMVSRTEHGVRMEECPACGGLWLDKGDFEILARREEEGWFGRLFRARQHDGR